MSQQPKVLSIRLPENQTETINKMIDEYSKEKGVTKGEALYQLLIESRIKKPEDRVFEPEENPSNIVGCNFLNLIENNFYCFENLHRTKIGKQLGESLSIVIEKCKACKRGKEQQREKENEKLLQKETIRKLIDFRKEFLRISQDGFGATCYMCKADLLDNYRISFSHDGLSLLCPQLENKLVLIKEVCRQAIDRKTQEIPCKYFIELEHHVTFTETPIYEKIKTKLPQIEYQEDKTKVESEPTIKENE